jgi:hypothetical protein
MSHEPRDPLAGLRPPGAPPELKARVLAAARQAVTAGDEPSLWDVLWESRPARAGWAAASLALILGHLLLPPLVGRAVPGVPEQGGTAAIPPELEEELELPEIGVEAPAFASAGNGADDDSTDIEKGWAS